MKQINTFVYPSILDLFFRLKRLTKYPEEVKSIYLEIDVNWNQLSIKLQLLIFFFKIQSISFTNSIQKLQHENLHLLRLHYFSDKGYLILYMISVGTTRIIHT